MINLEKNPKDMMIAKIYFPRHDNMLFQYKKLDDYNDDKFKVELKKITNLIN